MGMRAEAARTFYMEFLFSFELSIPRKAAVCQVRRAAIQNANTFVLSAKGVYHFGRDYGIILANEIAVLFICYTQCLAVCRVRNGAARAGGCWNVQPFTII